MLHWLHFDSIEFGTSLARSTRIRRSTPHGRSERACVADRPKHEAEKITAISVCEHCVLSAYR